MLTRFVRIQLLIFTTLGLIGLSAMVVAYMQVPTLLGIGRITVTLDLPSSGGLYQFSNVTYHGVQVGKVTAVNVTPDRVQATLSLDTSTKIPADLHAEVRSVSAVGEQYVDLRPRTDSGPYLRDGSVIPMRDTTIPQPVGPMIDQLSAMVGSIPKDKLSALLDESFKGLNGAGYDFGSLLDSSAKLAGDLNGVADRTRTLADDTVPFLDSQAQSADSIRLWARSLAGFSGQLVQNDPQLRTLLQTGPGFAQEASRLLSQIKPTLPVLLANLTTVAQVAVTYNASLRQLLVLLPPYVANTQAYGPTNSPNGLASGDFSLMVNDPPPCMVGFLPPSSWRSPADTTTIDTPDGLYCKLPQDSPLAVRGARNYPCMGHPGKRAPTVEICNSDKPYEPLAMRPHALGPYPIDPNLLAQGIPPDDRVTLGQDVFGPVEGTPLPPRVTPAPGSPPGDGGGPAAPVSTDGTPPPPIPTDIPSPPIGAAGEVPSAAPSSFQDNGSGTAPALAVARYDRTGRYVAPDGEQYRQSNLVTPAMTTWTDMLPTQ